MAIALQLVIAGAGDKSWCQDPPPDLTAIGLEAVMNLEVTSVSKKPEKLMDAAAAVQIITSEEIRRSGATSIPELLRLVTGVQVARINSNRWAVGVRGFTSSLSRSLLVLIDGRSVYSPLFAGVYWDSQDTLLEDIERIEVIRGPGATLWGANAVNGVINIITKSADRTQGTFASIGGGTEDLSGAGVRHGWETSAGTAHRAYAKFFDRDSQFHEDGDDFDRWHMTRAGFRTDGDVGGQDHLTLQGDAYDARVGERTTLSTYTAPYTERVQEDAELRGGNLLGRWTHGSKETSDTTLQVYYDNTHRREPAFSEDLDTFDLEFRHRLQVGSRHELHWGAGYRLTRSDTEGMPTIQFVPEDRSDDVLNAFIQDEVQIVPAKWTLTVGSKFEHNDYSGFNYQPNIRVLFRPGPRQALWSAVSRALRVPSRIEEDLELSGLLEPTTPTFVRLQGTKDFEPERLIAYELGYRVQPTEALFLDTAVFYNDYDNLLSLEFGTPFLETSPSPPHAVVPVFISNGMRAHVRGAEVACEWRPATRWLLNGSYSYLSMDLFPASGSKDTTTEAGTEGSSPRNLASLRSSLDLPRGFDLELSVRHIGKLPSQQIKSYTEADITIHKRLPRNVDLSLAGRNLLSAHHGEFAGGRSDSVEIARSISGRVVLRW
jgi:iron complex outermembrane receptor protein